MPGVPLDPEARAKAIETLARMIAQTLARSTQPQNEVADE
jgi:NADH:ubiquinone oxidoreductase subunit B-like Fe-S oxidoreductase